MLRFNLTFDGEQPNNLRHFFDWWKYFKVLSDKGPWCPLQTTLAQLGIFIPPPLPLHIQKGISKYSVKCDIHIWKKHMLSGQKKESA